MYLSEHKTSSVAFANATEVAEVCDFDEVEMIFDTVSKYLSAEPIPDYEDIKQRFVHGENISIVWTIGSGTIRLKTDPGSNQPVLIVILDGATN